MDDRDSLKRIIDALIEISNKIPIVFPIHPRTKKTILILVRITFFLRSNNIIVIEPLGYIDFLKLLMKSKFIMTDPGRIQEEATILNIPCLTLRTTTERPVTIKTGINILVGNDTGKILDAVDKVLSNRKKKVNIQSYMAEKQQREL